MTLLAAQVAPEAIDQFVDRRGRLSRAGSTVRHFIRTQPVGSVAIPGHHRYRRAGGLRSLLEHRFSP